jgi:hypothetical protein
MASRAKVRSVAALGLWLIVSTRAVAFIARASATSADVASGTVVPVQALWTLATDTGDSWLAASKDALTPRGHGLGIARRASG